MSEYCENCKNMADLLDHAEDSYRTLMEEHTKLKSGSDGRIRELEEGLRKLEWGMVSWASRGYGTSAQYLKRYCPVCSAENIESHAPDCWLSALIKRRDL